MRFVRVLSQIFVLCAAALALYDLVFGWFGQARFKIRTVRELWGDNSKTGLESGAKIMQNFSSKGISDFFLNLPSPAAALLLAVFFYLVYRLLFLVGGDSKSARL